MTTDKAIFGGGCFWCLEAVFEQIQGVERVVSGYAGGQSPNPTYSDVCSGQTGHAEVVEITFDPEVIAYRELLEFFFATHDPTTFERQGNDIGSQYRSVIYCNDPAQESIAHEVIAELERQGTFGAPILTAVHRAVPFYPAEDCHQQYFRRNPGEGYCAVVVGPKVAKIRQKFHHRLKPECR